MITGYRSIKFPERLSNGKAGHYQINHDIFPDGSFEQVKLEYPLNSVHAHLPPPPCRYAILQVGERKMAEERAQLQCPDCLRHAGEIVDNRRNPGAA